MGANVYLDSVDAKGYDTQTAATVIAHNIAGKSGKKIAIRAFGCTAGATATKVYFMTSLGSTTVATAAASGASELTLTAQPVSGNNLAANDWICVVQDNGAYHFSKVFSVVGYDPISLCTVLTGAVAALNTIYDLGIFSDDGHFPFLLTASVQSTKEIDGGVFYSGRGEPMRVEHANDAAAAGSIDYVTIDYLDI